MLRKKTAEEDLTFFVDLGMMEKERSAKGWLTLLVMVTILGAEII